MDKSKYQVVTFKHIAPFLGCFHEYQAIVVGPGGELIGVGWRADRKLKHVATTLDEFKEFYYVEDVEVATWDEYVYDRIREDLVPAFWNFAQEHDLPFVWTCKHCGETEDRPAYADTHCPGGVMISASAWYCEECYCNLTCPNCGSLNDPDEPWWDHDEELEEMYKAGYCPQCQKNWEGVKYERKETCTE